MTARRLLGLALAALFPTQQERQPVACRITYIEGRQR